MTDSGAQSNRFFSSSLKLKKNVIKGLAVDKEIDPMFNVDSTKLQQAIKAMTAFASTRIEAVEEVKPIKPGELHKEVGINFLLMIQAVQEELMTGFDPRTPESQKTAKILKDLTAAYSNFSDGFEYRDDLDGCDEDEYERHTGLSYANSMGDEYTTESDRSSDGDEGYRIDYTYTYRISTGGGEDETECVWGDAFVITTIEYNVPDELWLSEKISELKVIAARNLDRYFAANATKGNDPIAYEDLEVHQIRITPLHSVENSAVTEQDQNAAEYLTILTDDE